MNNWIRITPAANIPPREGRCVNLGETEVAIFNLGSRYVAFENRCPHLGGPLADGVVSNHDGVVTVTCPMHNWRICVDSGATLKPGQQQARVATFDVKVQDGIVMLSRGTQRPLDMEALTACALG